MCRDRRRVFADFGWFCGASPKQRAPLSFELKPSRAFCPAVSIFLNPRSPVFLLWSSFLEDAHAPLPPFSPLAPLSSFRAPFRNTYAPARGCGTGNQGHIALARAVFPEDTMGSKLDVLARLALWEAGLDYRHGTGHGAC